MRTPQSDPINKNTEMDKRLVLQVKVHLQEEKQNFLQLIQGT